MLNTLEGALQRAVFLINTSPMTRNYVALHNAFSKLLKMLLKVPSSHLVCHKLGLVCTCLCLIPLH